MNTLTELAARQVARWTDRQLALWLTPDKVPLDIIDFIAAEMQPVRIPRLANIGWEHLVHDQRLLASKGVTIYQDLEWLTTVPNRLLVAAASIGDLEAIQQAFLQGATDHLAAAQAAMDNDLPVVTSFLLNEWIRLYLEYKDLGGAPTVSITPVARPWVPPLLLECYQRTKIADFRTIAASSAAMLGDGHQVRAILKGVREIPWDVVFHAGITGDVQYIHSLMRSGSIPDLVGAARGLQYYGYEEEARGIVLTNQDMIHNVPLDPYRLTVDHPTAQGSRFILDEWRQSREPLRERYQTVRRLPAWLVGSIPESEFVPQSHTLVSALWPRNTEYGLADDQWGVSPLGLERIRTDIPSMLAAYEGRLVQPSDDYSLSWIARIAASRVDLKLLSEVIVPIPAPLLHVALLQAAANGNREVISWAMQYTKDERIKVDLDSVIETAAEYGHIFALLELFGTRRRVTKKLEKKIVSHGQLGLFPLLAAYGKMR